VERQELVIKRPVPVTEIDHVLNLVDWLLTEVMTAGGDGDAIWVVKRYTIDSVYDLLEPRISSFAGYPYWEITNIKTAERDKGPITSFSIGHGQEWLTITDTYNVPDWSQCTIVM